MSDRHSNLAVQEKIKSIAFTLTYLRKTRGYTQQDVADRSGLTRQMVSRVEASHAPSLHTLLRYCDAIDLDLLSLIDNERYTGEHAPIIK